MSIQEENKNKHISNPDNNISDIMPILVAEYTALREEILKRIEIQHQVISFTLIALGTILTVGFQTKNASIMLIYPVLALFLSALWLSNEHGVHKAASYIEKKIEVKVGIERLGWEHYNIENVEPFRVIGALGFRATFIVSEILAIITSLSVSTYNAIEITLLIIAIICTVLDIVLLSIFDLKRMRHKSLRLY